ncbi:olfactory receptor 11A1-like [Boleophthalmus pectinirostris]|uniref:olfactory receptor 11A1-like n=1 Tax=Boleophthalmus pectinirostris TaxID=150288 RepID=UPI00242BD0E8|nr:olfactory receptor 11A1-like [Boleophthalmus pectinirostris]
MVNSSVVTHFTLGAYTDLGPVKWLYFLLILSTYVLVLVSNVLLLVVICLNRTLHEPMYVLLCSLFLNEIWGSFAVFPMLLVQILRDVHTITFTFCFLQIFVGHLYASVEFLILAVITYDRYLAITFPLQYRTRMTSTRVLFLFIFPWFYAFVLILTLVLLTLSLKLCGGYIPKISCNNYSVVQLACSDTSVSNIYGILITILSVFGPLIFIFVSYVCILKVCFRGSSQTRQKALSTCTPHLASVINFSFGVCFEVLQSRFDLQSVPNVIRVLLSLYFLVIQPLFNPLIYGLKLSKVRTLCLHLLRSAVTNELQ